MPTQTYTGKQVPIHRYNYSFTFMSTHTQIVTHKNESSFTRDMEFSCSYLAYVHGGLCSHQFICNEKVKKCQPIHLTDEYYSKWHCQKIIMLE